MSTSQSLNWPKSKMLPALRANWMVALAFYPLVRFMLLAEPPSEMSPLQVAERFLWIAFWPIEIAIIVAANASGFSIGAVLNRLRPKAKALVVVWLAALVWSSLSAPYPSIAFRSAVEWMIHGYAAVAAWHLMYGDSVAWEEQFGRLTRIAPWVTVVVGLLGLALVYRIGLESDYAFITDIPGFAHIRHTGYIFAPAMILCIGCIAAEKRPSWTAVIALTLNIALCLWFGSRGPFFGLMCGLAAAFLLFADFRRLTLIALVGGATATGAALSVLVPSPENAGFNAVKRLFESSPDPTAFSSGRLKFWEEAATLILDRPLFGYGGGQFQHIAPIAQNMYRHPHDFVLQVIFDWGFLGGGAFLALIGLSLAAALRSRRNPSAHGQLAVFGAISMLSFALLDGILFYSYTTVVTLLFVVAALPSGETQTNRVSRDTPDPKRAGALAG